MIITVRHEMSEAIVCYEDKARDEWLFDFPAQVALCGTQIWWTTEVNQAFARLEEGFENAMKDYNKKQVPSLNFFHLEICYQEQKYWSLVYNYPRK